MKISELSDKLFSGLEPIFSGHGFSLNKSSREFKRERNGCIQIFDLFLFKRSNFLKVKPGIRIKVKEIEFIYKSCSSIEGRPYSTLGNHLFDYVKLNSGGTGIGIREEPTGNWIVEDESQIDKLIEVIPEYLESIILPYFDQNSSIDRVDELLNEFPRELSVHNYLYPLRANIAIIAAKLNKNVEFSKLLNVYEEELEGAEKTYRDDFYSIKNYLLNLN